MSFKEVTELRKSGKLEDALILAKQNLKQEPDNIWNKRSIAWVYYDYLKQNTTTETYENHIKILKKLLELELPEEEKMIFDKCAYQIGKFVYAIAKVQKVDYSIINSIFGIVKDFHFPKPSESYTYIYKSFHQHYKNWSNYLNLADWWNFTNFRSQDYLTEEFKGKKNMSIVEQAYIAYSKKLLEGESIESNGDILNKAIDKERIRLYLPKLEEIINKHPEYQHPPYYKAKLLLALGDKDDVLSSFLPFARQKKNDYWVWELIAEISLEDEGLSFACYCKALSLKTHEEFLVKLRQKFASLLIERKLYMEAKTEIENLIAVRSKNDWKIPNQVKQWTDQEWYQKATDKTDNKDLYLKHLRKAEEVLFQDIPEEIIAVEFVNENKNMLTFVKDKNKHGFFNFSNLLEKPKIGNVLKVRFKGDGQDGFFKVLTARKLESNLKSEAINNFRGLLKIILPQGFGFAEDVFIEPRMIENNNLEDNQEIMGTAILSFNKKKDEWGWKAITIAK